MDKTTHKRPFDIQVFDITTKVFRINDIFTLMRPAEGEKMQYSVHTHFTYEIFFATDSPLKLIAEDQVKAYERKVLIIPPKLKHCTMPEGYGNYCLLVSFEASRRAEQQLAALEARLQQGVCELPLTEDMAFYIRKLAKKNCLFDPASMQEKIHLASLLFYEMLSQLLDAQSVSQPEEKGNARHIYAIETYINKNRHQKISLSDVAASVALSPRQVSRIIQKEYNCTLSQLVTEKRLSSAEQLIRNSDLSIDQIASRSGLGSANYFYAVFKKRYGISPLQYRKRHSL